MSSMLPSVPRLVFLVNACVALVTSGVSLVLLLIAPLGLATVISLTLWIALCSLVGGLMGDLLLFPLLSGRGRAGQISSGRQGRSAERVLPFQR